MPMARPFCVVIFGGEAGAVVYKGPIEGMIGQDDDDDENGEDRGTRWADPK